MRQEPGPDRAVGGTTSAAAAAIGVAAITAEAGGCGLVEEDMVALHVRGLGRVLTAMGMADADANGAPAGAGEPGAAEYLGRFLWLRCAQEGWWEPAVVAGEKVAEGQLLGRVHSIDGGTSLEEIRSPADGVMIFLTSSPAVAADGLLLGLGAR
jgi:predicted deacylase